MFKLLLVDVPEYEADKASGSNGHKTWRKELLHDDDGRLKQKGRCWHLYILQDIGQFGPNLRCPRSGFGT